MPTHQEHANLIWQIADLLRGPYRPPQYELVVLPMTVLRRFECVLAPTKAKILAEYEKRKDKLTGEALDSGSGQGRRASLPQSLAAQIREVEGRPRQHRKAPYQLNEVLLRERS